MSEPANAIRVGKWEVGFAEPGQTLIRFSFTDRDPLIFAMPHDQAMAMAAAIIDQNSPATSRPIN
jgi:hypothetical protein